MIIKIHIERDFSFAEFEAEYDAKTGDGLPKAEQLRRIFDLLPPKDTQPVGANGLREIPGSKKPTERTKHREPPATSAQRRVLERYGEWRDGLTKSEASAILSDIGF